MAHTDVYLVWVFLASLAYVTLLLVKRANRLPELAPSQSVPLDLQDQLSSKIVRLERLIAKSEQQLVHTQELIARFDRAA